MSALLTLVSDPTIVIGLNGSEGLVKAIREFIAPIFLLAIGIAALSFLFQRQMTQFMQFIALAIGIAVFFYYPGVVEAIADWLGKAVGAKKAG